MEPTISPKLQQRIKEAFLDRIFSGEDLKEIEISLFYLGRAQFRYSQKKQKEKSHEE